jgi:hypothetical protein
MYRPEDISKINQSIEKIKEDAQMEYKKFNEPTLDESSKICHEIIDFIKRKDRVVYGGYAQNLLIMSKNKDDTFYKEINGAFYNWPDIADIEFYSPTPIQDLIELTEELYKQKIPDDIKNFRGGHERKAILPLEKNVYDLDMKLYHEYNVDIKYFYNEDIKNKIYDFYKNDFIFFKKHGFDYIKSSFN